jgi:DNA polymerase bacteriophage-type
MTFYFDFETRSRVGIHEGTDKYVRDCEPLILTFARDDEPVQLSTDPRDMEAVLEGAVLDREPMVAHNASFDFGVATHALHLRIPVELLRCTRAQAYAHGLPGALDALCKVLGIPLSESKDAAAGKSGIKLFSIPDSGGRFRDPADYPVEWAAFCSYAVSDTAALRAVHRKLPSHNYVGEALRWFALDQLINWRGFRLDKPLARAARDLLELAKERHGHEIAVRTDGAVSAATQRGRLLEYLNRHYGAALGDMRAATLRDLLDTDDLEPGLRWLVEARLEAAKSSGAKYGRGLQLVGPQDRIRFAHQVFGAGRTGRDSHKGYQPGNMVRQSMKAQYVSDIVIPAIFDGSALDAEELVGGPNTACANALRGAIVAAPGNELVDADFSNIESRLAGWLAAEEEMLRRYRAGEDLYKAWYAKKFHVPIEEVTDAQRQIAKVVYLSMQFLGGVGAFVPMAATYNLDLDSLPDLIIPHAPERQYTKAERAWGKALLKGEDFELEPRVYIACDILKQAYREDNANIFKTGYAVGSAVTDAIRTPGTLHEIAKCKIWATGTALLIQLPDDSRLTYFQPRIHEERVKDLETGEESVREYTSFMSAQGKQWHRKSAWAGLYWENIIQAIANRLLRLAAERIHADTLAVPAIAAYLARLPEHARTAIVLRVHDSLTLDIPVDSYSVERMIHLMCILPAWAKDFPVAAAGWQNARYGKW